ncbi:MAG TPA: GGDEF domain-containing protein, partial [Clostridia bacterium]|nr:GGDEF domain-containing protein [Clostridia bacterium]
STNKEWEYVSDLEILHRKWENLKALIEENVKTPSDMNLDMIMLKSEECWSIANYMVLQKQYSSQERASSFNYFMAILGVDLVVVLLLLLLVKRFVRDSLEVSNIYDPLTKVFNRRYFEEYIESKIVRVRKSRGVFSLIMLDIDYFKNVNDTYGHGVGDYVLETLAQVVKENIRKSDNLFRIGGEEFMIVLPDTTSEIAMKLAERVRKSVEEYSFNYVDKITISLGITQFKGDDEPETMMRKVDRALYRAKNNGRNRVEVEFNSPEFETTI